MDAEAKVQRTGAQIAADEWNRAEQSRKLVLSECREALRSRDFDRFSICINKSYDKRYQQSLMGEAMKMDFIEAGRSLLQQGLNPNSMSLAWIVMQCRSVVMLELLQEYGLNFTLTPESDNPLDHNIDRKILDWLLDHGLDINGPTNEVIPGGRKRTRDCTVAVLNRAAAACDIELFDHLVSRGADPSRSNALCEAACSKNASAMLSHLITKYNIDVDAKDDCNGLNEVAEWHDTPGSALNHAVTRSNIPAIETLLKYGAKIGDSYQIATTHEDTTALKLLLDAGADPSDCLRSAFLDNHFEAARLSLEYGGDIAKAEIYPPTPMPRPGGYKTEVSDEMRTFLDKWKEENAAKSHSS